MRLLSLLFTLAAHAAAQVDPTAPCANTQAGAPQCCYSNKTATVMGGIDFVDLASKKQGTDSPVFGLESITAQLNGYTFQFLTDANKAAFEADPWSYAPAYGGF